MSEVTIKPAFKILLLIALVIYIIGSCLIQADLYNRLGNVEHELMHLTEKTVHNAQEEAR